MSAVPFALDLLTADPLAAVRRIAAGDPPDLASLLTLAEDAMLLAAEAATDAEAAGRYRAAADLVAELPHGSSRTAPQLAQQARAA